MPKIYAKHGEKIELPPGKQNAMENWKMWKRLLVIMRLYLLDMNERKNILPL